MNEDVELLQLMEDGDVLVMGISRAKLISDETLVDVDVELADSGEETDVSKLRSFPFSFLS